MEEDAGIDYLEEGEEGFLLAANATTVSNRSHFFAWWKWLLPRVVTHNSCLAIRATVSSALWWSHQVDHASTNSSVNREGEDDTCRVGVSRVGGWCSAWMRRTFSCFPFLSDIAERVLVFAACGCRLIVVH